MMQNNKTKLKIAITGGYASGKSTVLSRFSQRGFKVYNADEIYNDLLNDEDFVLQICRLLDVEPKICVDKITLDREKVSNVVFNDREKLQKLNEFTHEKVYEKIQDIFENSTTNKIIFEIPLLFESKKENDFDIVLVVMRNVSDRLRFGAKRDNISENDANLRIKNQYNYDNMIKSEHTLIYNNGSLEDLFKEVDEIIENIERKIT